MLGPFRILDDIPDDVGAEVTFDLATTLGHIQRIYIRDNQIKAVHELLNDAWQHGRRATETSTSYIVGQSRSGKTQTLFRFISAKIGREVTRADVNDGEQQQLALFEGKGVRILYADLTGGATPLTLSKSILKHVFADLDEPMIKKETDATNRLIGKLNHHHVDMTVMDEAQTPFRNLSDNDTNKFASYVLSLENGARTRLVLAGSKNLSHLLIPTADNPLYQRQFGTKALTPFYYETDNERADFKTFVKSFADQLPFASTCLLDDNGEPEQRLLIPLYFTTRGVRGAFSKFMEASARVALRGGGIATEVRLSHEHLKAGFDELKSHDALTKGVNPFAVDRLPDFSYSYGKESIEVPADVVGRSDRLTPKAGKGGRLRGRR